MSNFLPPRRNGAIAQPDALTFNLVAVLPGRTSSPHSQRAYYRWVDHYLEHIAGMRPTVGDDRTRRMMTLSIPTLQTALSAQQLRAWLAILVQDGHGKQGLNQARSAIITLASLLSEAGWLDDYTSASMKNVSLPSAEEGQRPGRWLSVEQVRMLMAAARSIGTTEHQAARNDLVISLLCTMALRREEVSVARWGDFSTQNNRVVMQVHGKGRKVGLIDVPTPVMNALGAWRRMVMRANAHAEPHTPLLRRLWKGGRISKYGLTPDGVWLIINQSAKAAGIGHVAPHDLRRSVAGALHESGVSIDKISRLLRHSNVAVTERYLSKLPRRNEGAVLMSDMLGLEDETINWHGFGE